MNRLFRLIVPIFFLSGQVAVANPTLWELVRKAQDTEPKSIEWQAVMQEVSEEVNIDLAYAPDLSGPTLGQLLKEKNPNLLAKIEAGIRLCDGNWLQVSSACGTPRKDIAWRRVEALLKANHDHRWLYFRPKGLVTAGCLILIYNPKLFTSFFEMPDNPPPLWHHLTKAIVEGGPRWNGFLRKARDAHADLQWSSPTGDSILEVVRSFKPTIYDLHFKPPAIAQNYKDPSILGAGAGGLVWQATRVSDSLVVAVKCLRKAQIEEWELTWPPAEATLHKSLDHPNILSLIEAIDVGETVYLVTERMPAEFFNYIQEKDHLDESQCRFFMRQILSAVDYMHKKKICHRDLKLENMLLDKDGNIKIVDFGFACEFSEKKLSLLCGTPGYLAPEILMQEDYEGPKADIWALGVGFVAMATGFLPFSDNENTVALKYTLATGVSAALQVLFAGIFRYADTRFTMADILASAFMTVASDDKLK